MLLLTFLGSWGVIFVLATIGIVDCIFRRIGRHPSRFHFCAWGTAVSLPSERDGTERKRHRFSDSYCIYTHHTLYMYNVSSRTEFKQGGSSVKSLSLNSIMGCMRGNILLYRPIFNVHLDGDCVCTINEALLLQVAMWACTTITTTVVSWSWLWEATTLGAAHVAMCIFANQQRTDRTGRPVSSIVAETLRVLWCYCLTSAFINQCRQNLIDFSSKQYVSWA